MYAYAFRMVHCMWIFAVKIPTVMVEMVIAYPTGKVAFVADFLMIE